jgi:hypothetical protein
MMMNESTPVTVANDQSTGTMAQVLLGALHRLSPREVRIATAFLSPDGFQMLQDGLERAAVVRLLLGERPFMNRRGPADVLGRPEEDTLSGPSDAVDWYGFLEGRCPWVMLTHAERVQLLRDDPAVAGAAFDLGAWARVNAFVQFLQHEGVEVRRFLGDDVEKVADGEVLDFRSVRGRLHAKAYLFAGEFGDFASVGSSNLTRSGLEGNAELNLASFDSALVRRLEEWFGEKWEKGRDCKQEFITRLEECVLFGPRYTPWQVFLKSLHSAYGRYLELGLSEDVASRLADFQQHAVQRCISLLERHWGAMLADSVGLGKTYEGLGILAEFQKRRDGKVNALVVCPAQLEDNWSRGRLASFGIFGETVSMESLVRLVEPDEPETPYERATRERQLKHYQDKFDIVLVDESHNFRNSSTKRYQALMEIIRGGQKADKRVLLLTATPINNSIWDLYFQLSLITRGDDTWYAGRGPIPNLRSTFQAIDKGGGGTGLLDAMMLSLVRRTRHDVRVMQEAGQVMEVQGQALRFPAHEIPEAVTYSLQHLYGDIYLDVIDAIEHLTFAVYQLEVYGVTTAEADSVERVKQRNANFIGIMRTILLKRMESSTEAFRDTVQSLVDYFGVFLSHLERGKVMSPKQAYRLRAVLEGSLPDDDQSAEQLPARARETLSALFDAPADAAQEARLRADVEADRTRLQGLLDRLSWLQTMWGAEGDPKVKSVRTLLESLPATDKHGIPTKVALFTNYRDTADYLFKQLGGDPAELAADVRVRSNLSDERWMSLLTGSDDRKRRLAVLEHFAPLASHRDGEAVDDPALIARVQPFREKSIELLIATDVLSEGQNLQDAQYVINYDLHWNPVRMIQRAGRIDRLFSPHERVYIYNVMPEQGLEDLLRLVKSLTRKLETIEGAIALDASVLGEQIEARELDHIMALRRGGAAADTVYLEGERTQGLGSGLEVLNKYLDIMKRHATEDVVGIPDGVYSVKSGPRTGVYVMLRMPEELTGEVYWRFYPMGDVAHPADSPNEVLPLIESDEDALRLVLPPDKNPFVHLEQPLRAAVSQVGESYQQAMAAQSPDRFLAKVRRLLYRDDVLREDAALREWLDLWTRQPLPSDALKRRAMRDPVRVVNQLKANAPLGQLLDALRNLKAAIEVEGIDRRIQRPPSREPSVRDLELVAWELVVGPEGLPEASYPTVGGAGDGVTCDSEGRTFEVSDSATGDETKEHLQ